MVRKNPSASRGSTPPGAYTAPNSQLILGPTTQITFSIVLIPVSQSTIQYIFHCSSSIQSQENIKFGHTSMVAIMFFSPKILEFHQSINLPMRKMESTGITV